MITLPITLLTASILGLVLIWLSFRVINTRVQTESLIGDNGHEDLTYKIRSHANFTEYTPLFLILLGLLEVMGGHSMTLAIIAGIFVVARLLHVFGMGANANLKLRQVGMLGTFATLGALSFYGVFMGLTG